MNVISCKLLKRTENPEDEIKQKLNEILPKDIHIYKLIEMSNSFNAKNNSNNREYHYILPTFALQPRLLEKKIECENIDDYVCDYSYKLTPEFHEKIKTVCAKFKGMKKYHNFTKKTNFKDDCAKRLIYEFSCNELITFDKFECIKFKIIGQSFLYNQIRKMVGMF